MDNIPQPTDRELEILKILWQRGEATVRQVYEDMSKDVPIVQNTVQAFLRTMESKGLVDHHVDGRTFVYRPVFAKDQTTKRMVSSVLQRAFDGAMDQFVQSVLSVRKPTQDEIEKLEALIKQAKKNEKGKGRKS